MPFLRGGESKAHFDVAHELKVEFERVPHARSRLGNSRCGGNRIDKHVTEDAPGRIAGRHARTCKNAVLFISEEIVKPNQELASFY